MGCDFDGAGANHHGNMGICLGSHNYINHQCACARVQEKILKIWMEF